MRWRGRNGRRTRQVPAASADDRDWAWSVIATARAARSCPSSRSTASSSSMRVRSVCIVFLCTPNNPTGTSIDLDVIEAAYDNCSGIVIVDEAYAEFSRPARASAMTLLAGRPRLVVSRTMSKAFACAGLRLGYAIAAPELIDVLRLVRLPYHLSEITQVLACTALEHADLLLENVDRLIDSRDRISEHLSNVGFTVCPSDSNFVLFGNISSPHELWQKLLDRGILIRDIGITNHARVNAGTEEETASFLTAVDEILAEHPGIVLTTG